MDKSSILNEGAKHLAQFKQDYLSRIHSLPQLERLSSAYTLNQQYKEYLETHIQVSLSEKMNSEDKSIETTQLDPKTSSQESLTLNLDQNNRYRDNSMIQETVQSISMETQSHEELFNIAKKDIEVLLQFLSTSSMEKQVIDIYKNLFSYLLNSFSLEKISKDQYDSLIIQQTLNKSKIKELQNQIEEDYKQLSLSETLIQQNNKDQGILQEDLHKAYNKINDLTHQYDELYKNYIQLQGQSEELEYTLKYLLENYKPFNYQEFVQKYPL